jgi:hypothetical protein
MKIILCGGFYLTWFRVPYSYFVISRNVWEQVSQPGTTNTAPATCLVGSIFTLSDVIVLTQDMVV